MSAKEFYKKPPVNLPKLPPELWGLIIRHATLIPEGIELEFSAQLLGFNGSTVAREQFKSLQVSLITKRHVVRVNKAWQKLGTPFLYEYVALIKGKSLSSLVGALERYKSKGEMPALGWWTQRLDVNLQDYFDTPANTRKAVAFTVLHMPNLRILTFSNGQPVVPGVGVNWASAVLPDLDSCQDALTSIHFYVPPGPLPGDWTKFLENHPNIGSINGNYPISPDSQVTLNKVTTMHVTSDCFSRNQYYPWRLNLPSLRAITYGLNASGSNSPADRRFLERVGPQLAIIQVSFIHACRDVPTMTLANTLQSVFAKILETCPNLEQINFAFESWSTLGVHAPIFPPKVHTVGIRIMALQVSKPMTLAVFTSSLKTIAQQNPGLKRVQFLRERNVQALHHCNTQLYEGLRALKDAGIDVLDDKGALISPVGAS